MTLSRLELAKQVLGHAWHAPILRLLADRPSRYAEIRAGLMRQQGQSPGDGYISTELKGLRELGLVEQRAVEGTRRQVWALTDLGMIAVSIMEDMERPAVSAAGTSPDRVIRPREGLSMDEIQARAQNLDTSVAHPARRYNYWLGGKDNFAADRESGDLLEKAYPTVRVLAVENRRFLQRAVTYLAGEAGIDQFLDIGTGLPTADNTHEVAQRLNPASRVVYVDNDPMVMAHARALLTSTPQGRSSYIEQDLRNPGQILADATVRQTLDFSRPVAVMLIAVLHFIEDYDEANAIVHHLMGALPSGSCLAATNITPDFATAEELAAAEARYRGRKPDAFARTRGQFAGFFDGLRLVEPGISPVTEWRPTVAAQDRVRPRDAAMYAAVGIKP
ncbi:SAM-dependent methyltransferase [Actinoplanes sp. CA-131856]